MRSLVEHIADYILIVDREHRIQFLNRTVEGLRMEDAIGRPAYEFAAPEFREPTRSALEHVFTTGESITYEVRAMGHNGETAWYSTRAVPLPTEGAITEVMLIAADVTERRSLEAKVRQQQKLEAIGTLAAGVAHEVNNPINGIMGCAELMKRRLDPGSDLVRIADTIIQESQRVASIVKSLLTFARQGREPYQLASMDQIVEATLALIRASFTADAIAIEVKAEPGVPTVCCRSQQIQQVLMNLLTNARHSLNHKFGPSSSDKRVIISVTRRERDGRRFVRTTVEDFGVGIEAKIIDRVFDPFFTTKDLGEGTGLGLSVSHGIISEHGGDLTVESQAGEYAKFYVDLPLDPGEAVGTGSILG